MSQPAKRRFIVNPTIGCILLRDPVFLDDATKRSPETLGARVPRPVVKYETFPHIDSLELGDIRQKAAAQFVLVAGETRTHRAANVIDRRLITDSSGKTVNAVEIEHNGAVFETEAGTIVVACGAVNSAALLLRSGSDDKVLANATGFIGRNYMVHNNSVLIGIHPTKRNPTDFQKSFAINDFYFHGPDFPYPLGNPQPVGKLKVAMLAAERPQIPKPLPGAMAARSTDWWVMSKDLPDPENRMNVASDGSIQIYWKQNNLVAHHKLMATAKQMLREAGFPLPLSREMGIATNSHQVGTLRFGNDPATSVLDPYCKAHDLNNLYVVDSSFFPSSGAVNPALTIIAQAIRVSAHLMGA